MDSKERKAIIERLVKGRRPRFDKHGKKMKVAEIRAHYDAMSDDELSKHAQSVDRIKSLIREMVLDQNAKHAKTGEGFDPQSFLQ